MKDSLHSIGTAGPAGRGNRSTSPSAAARSLAGGGVRKGRDPVRVRPHLQAVPEDETPAAEVPPPFADAGRADHEVPRAGRPQPDPEDVGAGALPSAQELWEAVADGARRVLGADWEARLGGMAEILRQRLAGDYVIDDFGYDDQLTELLAQIVEPIAERWFRLQVRGVENIPPDGGALLVSNHSGTLPLDGLITGYAVRKHTGRALRPLGADLVFSLPFVAPIARKMGATLACNEDAERLLRGGELVGVWPEGFKGLGKPFSERYKLQRFGRGGFVSAALRSQVPIVPVSVVGAEEIYPLIANVPSLARLLGLPYLPVTPLFPWLGLLGMVPLPSKWIIEFGETVRTDTYPPESADDPMLLFNVTDQVRESIQESLYALLLDRGNPFV